MRLYEILGYPAPFNTERQEKLRGILRILDQNVRIQPFRDRIVIFGSMARGDPNANDLDIMLDFSDNLQSHGF